MTFDTRSIKSDIGKPRWELMPGDALHEVAMVMTHALTKYPVDNWRIEGGLNWSRIIGAAFRHLSAINEGHDIDEESGRLHAAHLASCALFLIHFQLHPDVYGARDDRFVLPRSDR